MTFSRILQNAVVALATVGMVLPNAGPVLAASPTSAVQDVALGQGGMLVGQVVSVQGAAQSQTPVVLSQQGEPVVQLTTNERGQFAVRGLRGGIYAVSTPGAEIVVRAWAPQTAPPSASAGLLLVPGGDAANGQLHNHLSLGQFGLGAGIVAAIITAIIVSAADSPSKSAS